MISGRLDRFRHLHRDRLVAGGACALLAVVYGVIVTVAGHPDLRVLAAAVVVMIACAAALRAQAVLVQLVVGALLWVVSMIPADSWWSLLAGGVLFAQFVAGELGSEGSDESAIDREMMRRWIRRGALVLAVSTPIAALGLLLRRAHVPGSLILSSALLIVLAGGLVALLWRYDLGSAD